MTRSPSLSRLLSVSAIVVSLAVAGSLALEDVLRRDAMTQTDAQVQLTNKTTPKPAALDTAADSPVRNDMVRVNYLERRLALLERQIVVLQTQLTVAQQDNVKFSAKLTTLQTQMSTAAVPLERVAAADPDADAQQSDIAPTTDGRQKPPAAKTMAKIEADALPPAEPQDRTQPHNFARVEETETSEVPDAAKPLPTVPARTAPEPIAAEPTAETIQMVEVDDLNGIDPIVTGGIDPLAEDDEEETPNDALAKLVKPEVRTTPTREVSRTRFGLSFNLYKSIPGVQAAWEKLKRRHAALLSGLEPRALVQGTQEGELRYRLIVGPIENAAGAAKQCARLAKRGIKCMPSVFSGEFINPPPSPPSPGTLLQTNGAPQPLPEEKVLSDAMQSLIANPPVPTPKPSLKPRAQAQTRPAS